jgi:hypothetical protein
MPDFIMDHPVKPAHLAFGKQKIDLGGSGPVAGCGFRPHLLTGPVDFPEEPAFRMGGQIELCHQMFHDPVIPQTQISVNRKAETDDYTRS